MKSSLLAAVVLAAITASFAVDEECVKRKLRGLPVHWPNPTDCSSFYRCTNKNIRRELLCPEGKEYNRNTGRCAKKGRNLCKLSLKAPLSGTLNPCVNKISGTFIADPTSCRRFNICNKNLSYPQVCDVGSYFNKNTSTCEPDQQTICWENVCVNKKNGNWVEDTRDCHSFFLCLNQEAIPQKCPDGSYFDMESSNCIKGQCPLDIDTTTSVTESVTTTACAPEAETQSTKTTTTTSAPETMTTPETTTTTCAVTETKATTTCTPNTVTITAHAPESTNSPTATNIKTTTACASETVTSTTHAPEIATSTCTSFSESTTTACALESTTTTLNQSVGSESSTTSAPELTRLTSSTTTYAISTNYASITTTTTCAGKIVTTSNRALGITTSAKICEGRYNDGDFVPNPNNNMLFYICFDGELLESSCEFGNYYNDEIKACLPIPNNERKKRNAEKVSTCVEGSMTAAGECDKYYKCSGGEQLLYGCGKYKYYNDETSSCEYDVHHKCWTGNFTIPSPKTYPTCPGGYKEGVKSPHKNFCNKFYICEQGLNRLQTCEEGKYFDKNKGECEKDVKNICPSEKAIQCSGEFENGSFLAHPKDCNKYYKCVDGESVLQECGYGRYFDPKRKVCELDIYDECWKKNSSCTCPGGYKEGQFSAHRSECTKYYICHDGHQVLKDCGINYYFNKENRRCELDTYHVCWPNLCKGKPKGTLVANFKQCNSFYHCQDDVALPGTCYEGEFFNSSLSQCVPDYEAKCYDPCQNETAVSVVLLPHPICNKYYMCNNGKTYVQTCPSGSFDEKTRTCDHKKKCYPNPCDDPDSTTFPQPHDPKKFYYCLNGQPKLVSCPDGRQYNTQLKLCLRVSNSDCPECPAKEGMAFATLNKTNDKEYCFCVGGFAYKSECPKDYVFNPDIGTCYSNDSCDPHFCATNENGALSPNRHISNSFCMCMNKKPIMVRCPDKTTFNPHTLKCSSIQKSSKCKQSFCAGKPDGSKGKLLDPKNSTGLCVCRSGIGTFEPCPPGTTYNSNAEMCFLTEINCNSQKCRGLANNTQIPSETTTEGYCECVDGKARFYSCPTNYEFNRTTAHPCQPVSCPSTKCNQIVKYFKPLNTSLGLCVCNDDRIARFLECPQHYRYSEIYNICVPECSQGICEGKQDGDEVESAISEKSYCVCSGGKGAYKECKNFQTFTGTSCQYDNKKLCSNGPKDKIIYEANGTLSGFCLREGGNEAHFVPCVGGYFDTENEKCSPLASTHCDMHLCKNATIDHPVSSPSIINTTAYFCYCTSRTDVMLVPCPDNTMFSYEHKKCVQKPELCPDGIKNGTKIPGQTCNKYLLCIDGYLKAMACPKGQYFDTKNKRDCVIDTNGIYCDKFKPTCLGFYLEGELVPHPVNKHLYYICEDNTLHERDCGPGKIFCNTQKKCVKEEHRLKRSIDFKANNHEVSCLDNDIRSVPSNCSQYDVCIENSWQRRTCPNYRYYNPKQKKCSEPQDDFVCPYARITSLPVCNASQEFRLYPAKSCQHYYYCQQGKWRLKSCDPQQYFDINMGTCLIVSQETKIQCAAKRKETIIKHFKNKEITTCQHLSQRFYNKNCAMYLMCLDNGWWYQHCPPNMYFNRSLNYCIPDTHHQCKDVIRPQIENYAEELSGEVCQRDGLLRASALACNRYFVCLNGKWRMQHCLQREFYDVANAKCSLDMEGQCTQLQVDCLAYEKRAVPRNCSLYEQCSNEGKWLKFVCPQGQIYDELVKQCVTNHGICSKYGLKRVCIANETMAVSSNCTTFYYCSMESWYLGSCLKGFTYSISLQMCVPHTPGNKCKPLYLYDGYITTTQNSKPCQYQTDGTSVPHPTDCSRYHICIEQSPAQEIQCPRGSYFNATLGYCRPNDGSCRLPLTGACANATDKTLVPHPSDCQAFYRCSSTNSTELLHCPGGEYFHNITRQCHPDRGECKKHLAKPQKCSKQIHGQRCPHENYCNIYYACVKNLAIPIECPDKYYFNATLAKCIPAEEQLCQYGHLVNSNGNLTYSCENLTDGLHLPDLNDCTRYYICSQGQAVPKKCIGSSYFDNELLLCVPDDGSCPFVNTDGGQFSSIQPDPMVCEGKHGFLMPDSLNCNNFYACVHGKLKHERCYSQHFFNKTLQQCQSMNTTEIDVDVNSTPADSSSLAQCLDKLAPLTKLCSEMGVGILLAEPGDCRRYIRCQDNDIEPLSQRCRNGESFDSLLGFCRQNDGTCLLENGQRLGECSGKHGQLAADLKNCRNYFVCINGQKIVQSCGKDEYFSKTQQMCVKDINKICKPTQPTEDPQEVSCAGLSETVLYPYIYDNCRSYFQCIKGVAKIHKCADDLYFDPVAIKCVQNKGECIMSHQTPQR